MNTLIAIITILIIACLTLLLNYVRMQKRQLDHLTRLLEVGTPGGPPSLVHLSPQDRLQLMETMLQAIPNPVFYKDCQGRYQGCNKAFERIIGFSKDEILGKTLFDLRPSDYAKIHHEEDLKLLQNPGIQIYESAGHYADGENHHIIVHKATYTNTTGEIIGIVGILTDITERKQLEMAIKNSEEKFRHLFEYSQDPCLLLAEGKFVDCNQAAVNILHYTSKEQLLQKSPAAISPEFQPDGQRSVDKAVKLIEQTFQKGSLRFEWRHRRANGEEFYVDVLLTVIPMHTKFIIYTVWRDLTDRKRTDDILQQRTKELQMINRISQLFNSTLEWKEVLQTVLGELQHLLGVTGASVWLRIPETGELVCQHAEGPGSEKVVGFQLPKGQGVANFVAQTGQSLIVSDTFLEARHFKKIDEQIGIQLRSILSLPLLNRGHVIGVLNLVDTRVSRFNTDDLKMLEPVAVAAANAIENARLYNKVQQELRERQRAEQVLARREAYLATLVEIQRRLLAFGSHQKQGNLPMFSPSSDTFPYSDILELLGPVSQASRVYILLVAGPDPVTGQQLTTLCGEWWATGKPSLNKPLWHFDDFPHWFNLLKKGEIITGRIIDFPPQERHLLEPHGLQSLLVLPLLVNGNFFGLIGFDNYQLPHLWEPSEISLLQAAAAAISLAKEHQQALVKLHQAKVAAEEARQAAELANRSKSAFLAHMSHELRTPLNGILGYTQLFRYDHNLTDQHHQGVQVIHRCGEHLLTLINDILDFSKMEAGKLELNPAAMRLSEFCEEIVSLFKMRAEQKGLTFIYQPLTRLPTTVYADAKRLRQILLNLIGNAVKFTQHGQVTLTVYYHLGSIRFTIEDTGEGIAEDQLQAIFLPFHQVGDKNRQAEGTGLGLPISKNLVELMGGQLQARSQLGKGSLFWFEIPFTELDTAITLPISTANQVITGFKSLGPQEHFKVLIADDLAESRDFLTHFLRGLGFQVREATNGQAALQLALDCLPDLILTDLTMPIMDGFELIRQVRQTPMLSRVIVIGFSANVLDSYRHNSLKAGCNEFLTKPINLDQLLNLFPKYLPMEWKYDQEETPKETPSPSLSVPSHEQVENLLKLAILGDIDSLVEQTTQLEQQDATLSPFIAKVKQLTRDFEIDKLETFLKQTIGSNE